MRWVLKTGNIVDESVDVGEAILPLMAKSFAPIEEVRICLMEDYRIQELSGYLPQAIVIK